MGFIDVLNDIATVNHVTLDVAIARIAGDDNAALFQLIVSSYDDGKDSPDAKDIKALKLSSAELKAVHEALDAIGIVLVDKSYRYNGRVLYDQIKSCYHCADYPSDQALIQFLARLPQV